MANPEDKSFHCELVDPTGKLLDCRATSVVLPAHDGQLGILYDHMPMLCQLGLGIMKVTPADRPPAAGATAGTAASQEAFFFLDGGCALVAKNTVTVIAYSALSLQGTGTEQIQALIETASKSSADPALSPSQRAHESERLRTLRKIAESHGH
ncbi:MAG: F0F1 ATP synthase subunit epsilon [Planctomycetes bacterium]|jgi:F0F1-type ATP synthase epsilon subunit|nr:F0F1 ATP synthase subunit epsilon [Planctomycetota bacterium]